MNTPRTPPRFVPTLTTVLELPKQPEPLPLVSETVAPQADPTTPVDPPVATPPPSDPDTVALAPQERMSELEAFRLEEQLLHRVLQRVDLSLEAQLSDAVSSAVQQQLDAMVPRLRDEIESVLRSLVIEALAKELSDSPGTTPS